MWRIVVQLSKAKKREGENCGLMDDVNKHTLERESI